MNKKLFRVDQVAETLNCSTRTVYRLIENCELDALKVRGSLRITSDSVDLYIKREISHFQENNGIRQFNRN